jgi:hypothetical protein
MRHTIRTINAKLLILPMKATGFRFSREYRHAKSGWKATVYRYVDTVGANLGAGLN